MVQVQFSKKAFLSSEIPFGYIGIIWILGILKDVFDTLALSFFSIAISPAGLVALSVTGLLNFLGFEIAQKAFFGIAAFFTIPLLMSALLLVVCSILFALHPPKRNRLCLIILLPIVCALEIIFFALPIWSVYIGFLNFSYIRHA